MTASGDNHQILPGWYRDPRAPQSTVRWWDGTTWTSFTQRTGPPGGLESSKPGPRNTSSGPNSPGSESSRISKCPDCGGTVSLRASSCTHCGAPLVPTESPTKYSLLGEYGALATGGEGDGESTKSGQAPYYRIGEVVNGHRWTGSVWEPVTHGAAPQAPQTPPKSWYTTWWGITLIAFGALILVGLIFGGSGGETTTTTPQPEQTAAQEETPTEAAQPDADSGAPGVGEPVRDGKFEFTVADVQTGVDQVGDDFLNQEAQGSYTLVTMKVENIGDEAQLFDSSNVSGTDSQGREVSSDSEASLYANENTEAFLNEINPGNSVTAIVVFDLPKGEKLAALDVKDSMLSGGAEISLN